jgi:hypothetical protein
MSLPTNFSGQPGEDLHHHFRNLCLVLKKTLRTSKNREELREVMEQFLSASKEMKWEHVKSDVFHKDEGIKAVSKVQTEFDRYVKELSRGAQPAFQNLLDALSEVERLVNSLKVK